MQGAWTIPAGKAFRDAFAEAARLGGSPLDSPEDSPRAMPPASLFLMAAGPEQDQKRQLTKPDA